MSLAQCYELLHFFIVFTSVETVRRGGSKEGVRFFQILKMTIIIFQQNRLVINNSTANFVLTPNTTLSSAFLHVQYERLTVPSRLIKLVSRRSWSDWPDLL